MGLRRSGQSEKRIARLEAIGMAWDCLKARWERFYGEAQAYFREHGDLNVPMLYHTPDGIYLGKWIGNLRRAYKKGTLQQEKIERLEDAGMVWSVGRSRPPRTARSSGARLGNGRDGAVRMR